MADTPPIDPSGSLQRALKQLTSQLKEVNKHLESLEQETQGGYLSEQKESQAAKKIREAGWSVAQAKAPVDQAQQAKPGSTSEYGSSAADVVEYMKKQDALSPAEKAASAYLRSRGISSFASQAGMGEGDLRTPHQQASDAQLQAEIESMGDVDPAHVGLGWMNDPTKIEAIRKERMEVPQYRWTQEKKAQATRDALIKWSGYAGEHGFGRTAKTLGMGAHLAEGWMNKAWGLELGKQMFGAISKFSGMMGRNVEAGTTLGYSGSDALGGQFIPGTGIPNPLSVFSSAGEENMGQKLGALEQAFQGNLPFGQASKMSNALAGQGFANTESGGWFADMMNFNNRGRNQELTELYSTAKGQGMGEKQFLAMTEGIKFGGGSIEQLTENIKNMGKAAKDAEMTTNMLAESMTNYAQMTAKQGTRTMQEGKAKEITEITGLPATQVLEGNESELGRANMARYGVLPGTGAATSPGFQAMSLEETVKQGLAMMGPGTIGTRTNKITGQQEKIAEPQQMQAARLAATTLKGVPINVIEKIIEHPGAILASGELQGAIKNYGETDKELEGLSPEELAKHGQSPASLQALKGKQWGSLWADAAQMGITGKQYNEDFEKGDKGGKKSREMLEEQAKAFFSNQEKGSGGKYEVGLTEEAKRWLTINKNETPAEKKNNARAGGKSTAESAGAQSTGSHA